MRPEANPQCRDGRSSPGFSHSLAAADPLVAFSAAAGERQETTSDTINPNI